MAKQRKSSKNEDPSSSSKPVNSGAVVRHQKLCLSIDVDNRRIFGYTELEIVVPDIPIVGLHAHCLEIERVLVDGEPAVFEYYPHQYVENDRRFGPVSSPSSAADAAGSIYVSALERELVPNLLINCCKGFKIESEQQDQVISENGVQSSDEPKQGEEVKQLLHVGSSVAAVLLKLLYGLELFGVPRSSRLRLFYDYIAQDLILQFSCLQLLFSQNVKLVRVDYLVEKAEAGIHFQGNILHTDNQIRRARCWFPCIDDSSQRCCYDLELTVAHNLVAVSSGSLLYQVLTKDDPPRKTYVYKVNVPIASQWISLAVAPFKIHPDHHSLISHMCLPVNVSKLKNTVEFFHSAFRHYEGYLSATFPFGSYKQVFIAPEIAVSSSTLGASMGIFSSKLLSDEKTIDQVIDTRIKLAYALAKQWFGVYITPETPDDEWLVDGLSGFLTDTFIKQFLGNNEARYRRYKANCAVCREDYSGATALSTSASCKDLYGTQCIGVYGKIRSWKSVAILQMLEKQMGPDSFQKILQTIVSRAQDATRSSRTLSTKEFRHLANKVGNLERPFLKEFFPRWVGSCGCPVLRMGLSYNKRKNMVELAVLRECTAEPDPSPSVLNILPESENRDGDSGWPGMMSIRVHELDGMHDHPICPMAGDSWQLLEIQCHSKLAAKRFQRPKRSSKPDGSDEYSDIISATDMRSSLESPLLWIRADPEMEYLADINFNQPVQMLINQLEKDRDVIAQSQAIASLEALPQISFSVVNALNNFLNDSKAFWRVRIEAAFALANTASEDTDWAGLAHLVKFFRSQRFDVDIGLPKPNDFRDFPEYFVLKAIPEAIATVRVADKKSPREAVEFILQLLKYNDNSGNPYSDVFWLATLVQAVGDLEFGQQNILLLSSLLKRIDRLLQFDRLMPSHNGILTISCIQTLTRIALKLSGFVPLDRVIELIRPFRESKTLWQVRIEASKSLLNIEFHCNGLDATLLLFIKYLEEEPSLQGQKKLSVHAMRICQLQVGSGFCEDIKSSTLVALLHMLESRMAFNNVFLRHYLFCIAQVLSGRPPTLHKVPRDKTLHIDDAETCIEQRNIFEFLSKETEPEEQAADIVTEEIPSEPIVDLTNLYPDGSPVDEAETCIEQRSIIKLSDKETKPQEQAADIVTEAKNSEHILDRENLYPDGSAAAETSKEADKVSNSHERRAPVKTPDGSTFAETPKEAENVSNSYGRRMPIVKIKVKQSATASRGEETDNRKVENSQGCRNGTDRGLSSSFSADTSQRNFSEAVTISNRNHEEANSFHDHGSRMTASIGSVKVADEGDDFGKELQCTADSSKVSTCLQNENPSSPNSNQDDNTDADAQKFVSLQTISAARHDIDNNLLAATMDSRPPGENDKKKDKDKEKKRKRDDPEYLERKHLKKEKKRQKKQKEKEIAKLLGDQTKPRLEEFQGIEESGIRMTMVQPKPSETSGPKLVIKKPNSRPEGPESTSAPKIRIKIKSRTLEKP